MLIEWKPDRNSEIKIYMQIIEFIQSRIFLNEWPIGTKLPSQKKLAQIFSVNLTTVRTAVDELRAQGLLESFRAIGTFVVNHSIDAKDNYSNKLSLSMPNRKV